MAKTYVSLDLETTGLDPQHDAVIEVGALRFSGSHEIESFSTFVNPGRRIPQFITELTGISDAEVARAPSIRQVAQELRTFVGDDTLVGHNIGFDVAFLRKEKVLSTNPRIDTFSLASILVPHAGRYSLGNLVHELGLAFEAQTHRALDDARLAHALFVALEERALQLPQPVLEAPRLGCLNIHASLLPRWRGAAPIQRAIMAGDAETGVCIMQMDAGLDTGTVLARESLGISDEDTSATLHDLSLIHISEPTRPY